jgi:hypothetical protein
MHNWVGIELLADFLAVFHAQFWNLIGIFIHPSGHGSTPGCITSL